MGLIIPNTRRRITTNVGNQKFTGIESGSVLSDGKFMGLLDNRKEVSQNDGSVYAAARIQEKPGTVIRLVGYGEQAVEQLKTMKEGDSVSAFMTPMTRGGYKLVEFLDTNTDGPVKELHTTNVAQLG